MIINAYCKECGSRSELQFWAFSSTPIIIPEMFIEDDGYICILCFKRGLEKNA